MEMNCSFVQYCAQMWFCTFKCKCTPCELNVNYANVSHLNQMQMEMLSNQMQMPFSTFYNPYICICNL